VPPPQSAVRALLGERIDSGRLRVAAPAVTAAVVDNSPSPAATVHWEEKDEVGVVAQRAHTVTDHDHFTSVEAS